MTSSASGWMIAAIVDGAGPSRQTCQCSRASKQCFVTNAETWVGFIQVAACHTQSAEYQEFV